MLSILFFTLALLAGIITATIMVASKKPVSYAVIRSYDKDKGIYVYTAHTFQMHIMFSRDVELDRNIVRDADTEVRKSEHADIYKGVIGGATYGRSDPVFEYRGCAASYNEGMIRIYIEMYEKDLIEKKARALTEREMSVRKVVSVISSKEIEAKFNIKESHG